MIEIPSPVAIASANVLTNTIIDMETFVATKQMVLTFQFIQKKVKNVCTFKFLAINDTCVVDTDCALLGNDIKCESLKCQAIARNPNDFQKLQSNSRNAIPSNKITLVNGIEGKEEHQLHQESESHSEPTTTIKFRDIAVQTSIDSFELKTISRTRKVSVPASHNHNHSEEHKEITKNDDEDKTLSTLSSTNEDEKKCKL